MHIHIFGSSGSGVTSLGKALGQTLQTPYFDTDDYYWEKTDPPFQVTTDINERKKKLLADLGTTDKWILGGSLGRWADFIKNDFDIAVYLWLPTDIREERLIKREKERGEGTLSKSSLDFIYWALAYDDNNREGRNKKRHEEWMSTLKCPLVRIETDISVQDKIKTILLQLEKIKKS